MNKKVKKIINKINDYQNKINDFTNISIIETDKNYIVKYQQVNRKGLK
tara:strand:+ start:249 stop:392 length:144 start_codon:yes stop_codon:yes gene_type:complete